MSRSAEAGPSGSSGDLDPPENLHLWKLPRGRHGLPRELVARSQHERLLAAVVRVTAAKGYQASSVADILKEAGEVEASLAEYAKTRKIASSPQTTP